MRVDFYYWGFQCPLHGDMLRLLERYRGRLKITCLDVSKAPELARRMGMFFPMLTVVQEARRYFSPLREAFLEALCREELPEERPYRLKLGTKEATGSLELLTKDNFRVAGACTGQLCESGCMEKAAWLGKLGQPVFGCVNVAGTRLLGGAEFLPSLLVPYAVPKGRDIAFLTCVYLSDALWDYKSPPLRRLEAKLAQTYRVLEVISDEKGVFPNGDLAFFLRNGYKDQGVVAQEPGYCRLHLLQKALQPYREETLG